MPRVRGGALLVGTAEEVVIGTMREEKTLSVDKGSNNLRRKREYLVYTYER